MSLGNGQELDLNEQSVSIVVPLSEVDRNQVRSLLLKQAAKKVKATQTIRCVSCSTAFA